MLAPDVGLRPLLVRLGLVAGLVLALIVLTLGVRELSTTRMSLDGASSAPSSPSQTKPSKSTAAMLPKAAAALPSSDAASFKARISIPPGNTADLVIATKLMLPAPPDTESKLQDVDPRTLRAIFQRGRAAMQSNYSDETTSEGARLVNIAAILGYEPARMRIVDEYPRSSLFRSTVSSAEAVRFSLDPLFMSGEQSEGSRAFLVLLASYFSGRQALAGYATDLLAALRDDRRLQSEDRVQTLLELLARVHGACTAIAFAVVKARTVTGPECSPGLNLQIENYLRTAFGQSRSHSMPGRWRRLLGLRVERPRLRSRLFSA